MLGSHDLPTLRAWWSGDDLKLKKQLNLFPEPGEFERQSGERAHNRKQLLMALRDAHLIQIQGDISDFDLLRAEHGFIARTSSMVAMAQLDDLTEEIAPVNVPGTSDQHPNWRRKHSVSLEELSSSRTFLKSCRHLSVARKKSLGASAIGSGLTRCAKLAYDTCLPRQIRLGVFAMPITGDLVLHRSSRSHTLDRRTGSGRSLNAAE